MSKFSDIKELAKGGPLTESKRTAQKDKAIKPKLVPLPEEWHNLLKAQHHGTISSYILTAVKEKMLRDGYL